MAKKINTLNDLIELGKLYDSKKDYNIDLQTLNKSLTYGHMGF